MLINYTVFRDFIHNIFNHFQEKFEKMGVFGRDITFLIILTFRLYMSSQRRQSIYSPLCAITPYIIIYKNFLPIVHSNLLIHSFLFSLFSSFIMFKTFIHFKIEYAFIISSVIFMLLFEQ